MKNIVITGAASGIGWALAKQYWQQGYTVYLVDRDQAALVERQQELKERVFIYCVDLLDFEALNQFCQTLIDEKVLIHRLVNNAGITHRSPASTTDLAVFDRVMTLNWQVPVTLSRGLLSSLSQAQGKIINIASMAALMPVPGRAAYCASKSALVQHFETWRPELLNQSISLLMVFPSFVMTNIESNALGKDGKPATHAQSKIGKQIGPDEMATLIFNADNRQLERYLSNSVSPRIGNWLYFLFPKLYQRITWKKFAGELS